MSSLAPAVFSSAPADLLVVLVVLVVLMSLGPRTLIRTVK